MTHKVMVQKLAAVVTVEAKQIERQGHFDIMNLVNDTIVSIIEYQYVTASGCRSIYSPSHLSISRTSWLRVLEDLSTRRPSLFF